MTEGKRTIFGVQLECDYYSSSVSEGKNARFLAFYILSIGGKKRSYLINPEKRGAICDSFVCAGYVIPRTLVQTASQ